MTSHRRDLTTVGVAVVVVVLGLVMAPAAVLAQTGWQPQTLPALEPGVTYSLADVKALRVNEAWVSGGLSTGEAFVMKTTNGTSWSLIFRKGADANPWISFGAFNRLSLVDSNTAWAGGINGLTAFTVNGGSAWSREAAGCDPASPAYPPIHVYALKAVDATNVWTGGWDNSALRGLIWHRPYTGDCNLNALSYYLPYRPESIQGTPIVAIDAADAGNAWAVLYALGGILHTTDGGNSWTQTGSPTGGSLYDVAVVNANVAWVVGAGGGIAKTSDGGSTWVVQGAGVDAQLNKIAAVNESVAWAVGGGGTIVKTIDGGATWRSQVSGTEATLVGVAAASATTAWAVGDGMVFATADGGVYQPLSAPGINYVEPAGGPIAGGTVVTIHNRDLRPGARVYFDGVLATRTAQEGVVTTPAHAAGIVDVTVVNPDGQSATLAHGFAYADTQPLVVRLSPSYGYVDSPAQIDIYGAGLTPAKGEYTPVPTVTINGTAVPGIYADYDWVQVVFDRSLLTAVGAGLANVTVTTAAGTSNTLQFAVNYGFASVALPSPAVPPNRSVTVPSLSGPVQATFYGLTREGWITVGKVFEQPGWVGGHSSPPAGYAFLPSYYYDVATRQDLRYKEATICFPYAHADVAAAGLDESKLRLMRFLDLSATWEDVTFTLDTSANVICGTTGWLIANYAIAQGPVPVPPPVLTAFAPGFGPPAGGTTVTIGGTLFQPNPTVTFGGVAATNVAVVSGMTITATIPAHALGIVDVVVTNPDGQKNTLFEDFTGRFEYVGPPAVTAVTPNNGRQSGWASVTITGTGFRADAVVRFGGTNALGYSVVNDTTITGYSPSHAAGPVDVVVTNADGQSGTLANGFTYVAPPNVATVVPIAGPLEGGTPVTITGTGFQAGGTVTIGGTAATDVVVVNAASITAVTPAHAAGTVSVVVTNPDAQTGTRYPGFTYRAGPAFTDDPLVVRSTVVKLAHFNELRQAIDTLRARYTLGAFAWTNATLVAGVTPVKAVHLTELRAALNDVYVAAARALPTYTHATVTGGATVVTAADIAELRAAILAVW